MPRLTIRYGDLTLHDDEVDELHWVDAPGQVTVTGKLVKPASSAGLMNLLAGARKTHHNTRPGDHAIAATEDHHG